MLNRGELENDYERAHDALKAMLQSWLDEAQLGTLFGAWFFDIPGL